MRFSLPMQLLLPLSLFAMTACSPVHVHNEKLLGNPQEPYPVTTPPKVGEIVHMPTGTVVTLPQMLNIAADARVVYVGETHDNPASHRLELQVLQGLEERHPGKVALGMEMFVRSQQPILDRWVKGELDEKEFLRASKWFDNWKMDFGYYRDLLIFAKERHIPLVALNAEKSMVEAVRGKTPAELTPEQKAQLPQLDETDPYQRGMTEAIFSGHSHAKTHMQGFMRTQTLWDETMAESAVRYLNSASGKDRQLVVIAGGNHVNYGFGIPRRVFRRLPTSYLLIGGREIAVAQGVEPVLMDVEVPIFPMVPYDFLTYMSYESLPKGVMLGVMFDPAPDGRGLLVQGVTPASNAERAGVMQGDRLLVLDGVKLNDSYDLVYTIKQKHAGDRSVLQIERQGKPMQLEVVFKTDEKKHGNP